MPRPWRVPSLRSRPCVLARGSCSCVEDREFRPSALAHPPSRAARNGVRPASTGLPRDQPRPVREMRVRSLLTASDPGVWQPPREWAYLPSRLLGPDSRLCSRPTQSRRSASALLRRCGDHNGPLRSPSQSQRRTAGAGVAPPWAAADGAGGDTQLLGEEDESPVTARASEPVGLERTGLDDLPVVIAVEPVEEYLLVGVLTRSNVLAG